MKDLFAAHNLNRTNLLVLILASIAALSILGSAGWAGKPAQAAPLSPLQPEVTCPAGGQCFADVQAANTFYEFVNRLYKQEIVTGYACGGPGEPCDAENRPYYRPGNTVTRQQMAKFVDQARRLPGIEIDSSLPIIPIDVSTTATSTNAIMGYSSSGYGVYGRTTSGNAGVLGYSNSMIGVMGDSISGTGVRASSISARGLWASSVGGTGVAAYSDDSYGLFAESQELDSLVARQFDNTENAGYFIGNVEVLGNCVGCLGTARIDHPLDPANKFLSHSAVGSSEMLNIYSGNVTTDAKGDATVTLPSYFEAVNTDFRYQLTVVGQFAQAIINTRIAGNSFTIKTDKPNVDVSWQVTGVRHDPYAVAHPVVSEEAKPAEYQGMYLHPELYDQPRTRMIGGEQDIEP